MPGIMGTPIGRGLQCNAGGVVSGDRPTAVSARGTPTLVGGPAAGSEVQGYVEKSPADRRDGSGVFSKLEQRGSDEDAQRQSHKAKKPSQPQRARSTHEPSDSLVLMKEPHGSPRSGQKPRQPHLTITIITTTMALPQPTPTWQRSTMGRDAGGDAPRILDIVFRRPAFPIGLGHRPSHV
ncbi:hypothetical protein G7046_g2922 [Stylonectria norvegica]|nr:hypothetical protein G7046_g2922 [Stylonectria norvegica]